MVSRPGAAAALAPLLFSAAAQERSAKDARRRDAEDFFTRKLQIPRENLVGRPSHELLRRMEQRTVLVEHYAQGSLALEDLWPSDIAVGLFRERQWALPAELQAHVAEDCEEEGESAGEGEGGAGGGSHSPPSRG